MYFFLQTDHPKMAASVVTKISEKKYLMNYLLDFAKK